MTTTNDGKPPKRRLITGRTSRGWVVFAANTGGVLLIGNGLYVSVAMSFTGHPGNGVDWSTVSGAIACFGLAGIIASPRASDAILRLLGMVSNHNRSVGGAVKPPPLDPSKWPDVKSRDADEPSEGEGN
mgnify:CR=1 FL=1